MFRFQFLNVTLSTNLSILFGVFEHIQERRIGWFELTAEITELRARILSGFEIRNKDPIILVLDGDVIEQLPIPEGIGPLFGDLLPEIDDCGIEMVINDGGLCEGTELTPTELIQEVTEMTKAGLFVILLFLLLDNTQLDLAHDLLVAEVD